MKKNNNKIYKKIYKNVSLLEDLKKSLLNFILIMNYTIHKLLVLIKNRLKYLQDNIF